MTIGILSDPPGDAITTAAPDFDVRTFLRSGWPVLGGIALLSIPVLAAFVAGPWASDQGSHGMVVLALAIWMVARRWPAISAAARPGHLALGLPVLLAVLALLVFADIIGYVAAQGLALYAALVTSLYLFTGIAGISQAWFPVAYGLLAVPPPSFVIASLTINLRLWITDASVWVLDALGYPVASTGLSVFIDRYEVVMREACSGINSLTSLIAIGMFYVYFRRPNLALWAWGIALVLICAFAVIGNFARVIAILLMTAHFGSGVAQGPMHETTGLITFIVALGGIMAMDALLPRTPAEASS